MALVVEVTDNPSLLDAARKRLQVEHAAHASPAVKLIKLADDISNLRPLYAGSSTGWSRKRREEYTAWSKDQMVGCRDTNARLEAPSSAGLTD